MDTRRSARRYWLGYRMLLAAVFLATSPYGLAASEATIPVTVTLFAPPCRINNNKPIEVNFGEVMTTRVVEGNYREQINYSLVCRTGTTRIKLQIRGAAGFDDSVLQTSKAGLGIELQQDSKKFPVNSWLNFDYLSKPDLWAVLAKQPGISLSGGEFTAVSTMTVDYQ